MSSTTQTPPPTTTLSDEAVIDGFIATRLPDWLKHAPADRIKALRESFSAHMASGRQVTAATQGLLSPWQFAQQAFSPLIKEILPGGPDLEQMQWLDIRFGRSEVISSPSMERREVRFPALLRLMQGFATDSQFFEGSGLVRKDDDQVLSAAPEQLARRCHALDAGQQYQALLTGMFSASTLAVLAKHQCTAFALACERAAAESLIDMDTLAALKRLTEPAVQSSPGPVQAYAGELRMLQCTIENGLLVQLRDATGASKGVVYYLPADEQRPLRHFASQQLLSDFLKEHLSTPQPHKQIRLLVSLKERAGFMGTLDMRLSDDEADFELQGRVVQGDIFEALARNQVNRLKEQGRLVLVPSADADRQLSEERLRRWQGLGLDALGLVGLAVPVVGVALFAKMVWDTLGEVYEGAVDWHEGHQHEAMQHMLQVAETVAVTGALVVGAGVVASTLRSGFVDALEPVNVEGAGERLWNHDLKVYESDPGAAVLQDDGLYALDGRQWLRVGDRYYEVHRPVAAKPRRLRHPRAADAFGPLVEHNGERFWRLRVERPLEWSDSACMLNRLWSCDPPLDDGQAQQILRIAGMEPEELRGVLVENRPAPVNLGETLRRFHADQRITRVLEAARAPDAVITDAKVLEWARNQSGMAANDGKTLAAWLVDVHPQVQGQLLEHLAGVPAPVDELGALVKRDFPNLPDVYVEEAVRDTDHTLRRVALLESRVPVTLARCARALSQLVRVNRALEGVFFQASYSNDTGVLVLAQLERLRNWPRSVNFELREGNESGRLLAIMNPQESSDSRIVLVWRRGRFHLYDSQGLELEDEVPEPASIFDAISVLLKESDRKAMGIEGADCARRLREALIKTLPSSRSGVLDRLGLRATTPWFNPGKRLADGRVGYTLGGSVSRSAGGSLRARIRALYPGFSDDEIETYQRKLHQGVANPYQVLLSLERNLALLEDTLEFWVIGTPDRDMRTVRRQLSHRLCGAWRYDGEMIRNPYGEAEGMLLNISGWRVGSLPVLPASVDFDHISELVMAGMGLDQLPASFLHCFQSLRTLNLNNNQLTALPESIADLPRLRALHLMGNRIRMGEHDQQQLANLSRLHLLDLSRNPIRSMALRFHQLPQLATLRLNHCGMLSIPGGIERCGMLLVADLRNNLISNIPPELLRMPWEFRHHLRIRGNPIPHRTIARLYGLDAQAAHLVPDPAGAPSVRPWLERAVEAERPAREAIWQRLHALDASSELFELMAQLTQTTDFSKARDYLSEQVWTLFASIDRDTDLRERIFASAREVQGCHDSTAERFSRLLLEEMVYQANRKASSGTAGDQLLALGRQLFRLECLDQFAQQDAARRLTTHPDTDVLEVVLGYRVRLAAQLQLPGQPRTMRFEQLAGITPERERDALAAVRASEATDELPQSLCEREFWGTYLRHRHAKAFAAIAEPFQARGTALDKQSETLGSEAYAQQWNDLKVEREVAEHALTWQLTRQALVTVEQGELLDPVESAQPD
ncbi:NEL-type E3 ubiquitin ligase domain-containing protein [Pseudomonas mosselii]|uniref:NEL-type E3 ubiquitin ligase domain-containing protein n=1 Tax=Pseudomonas mosselii TaxID=78327 RepID=UPI000D8E1519|nr:NEL-type E3 ubiquitin ligase domain-containing protein [Pseudomonas mosselii]PYC17652.1 hypothetical protein DMX06_18355 [Pseudomonas mosselii]